MLSIVTESISNKNQIMNILSDNYHTILISIITVLLTILISYITSTYYHRNYKNKETEPKPKQKETQNTLNKPQPQQQQPANQQNNAPQFVPVPIPSAKITPTSPPPTAPNEIPHIPHQFDFISNEKKKHLHCNYRSSKDANNAADIPFVRMPNNINFANPSGNCKKAQFNTIAKITKITTIQIGNEEPVTIKQETSIDINKQFWSPFMDGLRFAVKHDQGKRHHMENSASIIQMNNTADGVTYSFSLFDGHLGDEAAKFCTQHLHEYVSANLGANGNSAEIVDSIRKAFHRTDATFKQFALSSQCEAGAVGVYVYYQCHKNGAKKDCIYVANVGDCRAILCSNGKLKSLTIDHNPKNEDEKKRCGQCIDSNSDLLSGQISVTRAIGDYYVMNGMRKLDGLICDPHIAQHQLTTDDEFLIIACDGLWDVMDDTNAMTACRRSLRKYGDVEKAADTLIELAAKKSDQSIQTPLTSDNISVMVIGFAKKDNNGKEHIGPKYPTCCRPPGGSRFRRRRATTK